MSETPQDRADRLTEVALTLAERVRDYEPGANGIWLRHMLPDPDDRFALCFVLAGLVPLDRSFRHLTAWLGEAPRVPATREVDRLEPCGTRAAYRRHLAHGEEPCEPCDAANKAYDRARKTRERGGEAA